MNDVTFAEAFESNMKSMGLPAPKTIFGAVGTTLGTVGALAGAIAKVGATATVSEMFLTIPLSAGATVTAAAIGEIVAICGALSASFYVGACLGSVLVAAYETLNVFEIAKVISWLDELKNELGESVVEFLERVTADFGLLSPIRKSVIFARNHV